MHMGDRWTRATAAAILWGVVHIAAWATTIQLVSLEHLSRSSSDVVRGEVTAIEGFWNNDRSAIYTSMRLRRQEVLKGDPPSELIVFLPGGTVDGKTSLVIGAPQFQRGQQVVLFLNRVTDLALVPPKALPPAGVVPFQLSNLFQGTFNIVVDSRTGRRMAINNAIRLFPGREPELVALGGVRGLRLEELTARVRAIR